MLIIHVKKKKLSAAQWTHVLTVFRVGGVVAFPTDTAYALGVDPRVAGAAKKIFSIKGRSERKPLSVTVASTTMAKRYGIFSPLAGRLAKQHWPGALTLVVPLKKSSEARPLRNLHGGNSVGLRYPDHPIAIGLAKKLGFPITSTSANRSGKPACYSLREFLKQMGRVSSLQALRSNLDHDRDCHAPPIAIGGARNDVGKLPDLFLDVGDLPRRPTSTVVACTGKESRVLRQGTIRITLHS